MNIKEIKEGIIDAEKDEEVDQLLDELQRASMLEGFWIGAVVFGATIFIIKTLFC